MAILDFLTGGKAKRELAARLIDAIHAPIEQLHNELVVDAGQAQLGPSFGPTAVRFTTENDDLTAIAADDIARFDHFLVGQLAEVRPVHAEIMEGVKLVLQEWSYGGRVSACAHACQVRLKLFAERAEPQSDHDRLLRLALFFDIDGSAVATLDELGRIARVPRRWARPG